MNYNYVIPLNPASKKNSMEIKRNWKTGKNFIGQSERYLAFEEAAAYFLRPKPKKPINYPVTVKVIYYRSTRIRVDKTNLESAICDVLVAYGILKDDCRDIIASTDGSRVYYDKEDPRVEIEISPFEEEYEQWREW